MSKYSLLLFDLDGTIVDTIPCLIQTMEVLYKKYGNGKLPSKAKLASFSGPPVTETMAKEFPNQDPIKLANEYIEIAISSLSKTLITYDGAIESLGRLKESGMHIVIITNKFHKPTQSYIDALKLNDIVEFFVAADDVKVAKPDGEGCLSAMKKLNITNPEEVLYIGDNTTDLLTAKNAGIDCALVTWGPNPVDIIYEPAIKADTFEELTEKILNA